MLSVNIRGHSLITSRLREGEGVRVQCDTLWQGGGLVDAFIRMGKKYKHSFISLSPIFTGFSCLSVD